MKAYVEKDGCISCGLCVSTCPEVFQMGEDDLAEVYVEKIEAAYEEAVNEAAEGCPVSVIHVE